MFYRQDHSQLAHAGENFFSDQTAKELTLRMQRLINKAAGY